MTKKNNWLVLSVLMASLFMPLSVAQEPMPEEELSEEKVFFVVETMPQFSKAYPSVGHYIAQTVIYPEQAQIDSIVGRVMLTFVVGNTGYVRDIKVIKSVHPLLDAEATRVIEMMPRWKPGEQRGKPVSVSYTVPINFQLY